MSNTFLWGDDYVGTSDHEDPWLIKPIMGQGSIINLYGKPKAGKSFAAIGMAIAISSGASHWNGLPVEVHGPVAYLQIDTPRTEWKRRFRKIKNAGYDISKIAIMDMEIAPYPYNVLAPQHQAWLKLQLNTIQPVLVVVDTLREVHEGEENSSTDMKKVINSIVALARPAAIAFVSHSRKDSAMNAMGAESDLMDEGRGSSYVSGRMDTVLKFTGGKKKNGITKGHMFYKGRSVELTKVAIQQDEATGLIVLDGDDVKLEQLVLQVMQQHAHEWSKNKMAEEIAKLHGSISAKTATRRITELTGLVEDAPQVPLVKPIVPGV